MLDQQPVGRDLRHAADEADQQDAPAPAERRQRRVEQLAADGIEADVGAFVAGQRHHPLGELLGRVVDRRRRRRAPGHRELLRRAGGGDDARAHGLADLDRGEADAAGRAQHQQRLARLEPTLPADRHVARDVGDGEGAGLGEAHAVGIGEGLRLRRHRVLGEAAIGQDRHHPIARLEARHVRPAGRDHAGGLQPRAERQRRAWSGSARPP